jgi:hypothetical protein
LAATLSPASPDFAVFSPQRQRGEAVAKKTAGKETGVEQGRVAALSLTAPRSDDPMANVSAPVAHPDATPDPERPSHIELMQATRVADLAIPDANGFHSVPEQPDLSTSSKIRQYVKARMQKWDEYLAKNGRGEILRKRLSAAREKLAPPSTHK